MKYRKAHFKRLPVEDLARLSYLETFIEQCTTVYIEVFLQDVLRMTTLDWLKLPLQLFAMIFLPVLAYLERRNVFKILGEPCDKYDTVSIRDVTMYWRHWNDFSVKPDSYLRK